MNEKARLQHVEILRGISVLLVLGYHLSIPGFSFAYLGVDVFFVISGFLMALLYGDIGDRASIADFFRRRLSRLLPAYFVVLIIAIAAAALLVLPHEFADAARYSIWSALLAPNIGFWLDASYFDNSYFRPFLNFWSLGVELQFYLLFPLIAIGHRRYPWLVALLTVGTFLLFLALYMLSPKAPFFLTPFRIWQFMLGFYVARLSLPQLPRWSGETVLFALLALLAAAPIVPVSESLFAVATALLAAIYIRVGLDPAHERALPSRVLTLAGTYSYSIYLVHFPVIAFLAYEPFAGTSLQLSWPSGYVAAVGLTLVLSVLLYHLVETPLRRPRPGGFILKFGLGGSAVAAGIAFALVPLNARMLPEPQFRVIAAWFDRLPYRCPKLQRLLHIQEESCLIAGEEDSSGLLLVGDSHADVVKRLLGEEAARAGGNLRLTVQNYPIGDGYSPHQLLDEAVRNRSNTIVLHSTRDHIKPQAIAELAALAAPKGISVAVVGPIPDPGYHVPKFIYSELQAGRRARPTRTIDDYEHATSPALTELRNLAAKRDNVHLYEPQPLLCTPLCQIQNSHGQPLYSDDNHLTQTGASLLLPLFRNLVNDANRSRLAKATVGDAALWPH